MKLQDRVAVITGGARGIGLAIGTAFAKEGAKVVLADLDVERAESEAEELRSAGLKAIAIPLDVTDPASVSAASERVVGELGRVDVLVNNAGITIARPSVEMPLEIWQKILDVNLTGCFLCSQAFGRPMIEQGKGVIINMASVAGERGLPGRAPYCVSKAGVISLTKVLGTEWAPHGVRVVAIGPAWVETEILIALRDQGILDDEQIKRRTPLNRLGQPDEIAKTAVFLASDDASYFTGSTVFADGGYLGSGAW